jgi:hypothetical protein
MKAIYFLLFSFLLFGCDNVFEEIGKKDTPEAIYYEAKLKMNDQDYDTAIALLQSLGPTFLAQRDVSLVYASAFSGRCGLNFVNLVDSISNIATTNLFLFLMGAYPNSTDPKIADCLSAESILASNGDYTARLSDENILMGMSSLTKVGTILARYADTDNDGTTDAVFDHCDLAAFPDEAVRQVGTGIANAVLSVSAVASDIASDALTQITDLCAQDANLNAFCTNTDATAYSVNEVRFLRALLGSSGQGIGACVGNFTDCVCP